MIIRACAVIFLFWTTQACADVFRYVSEDGVECFTDSPTREGAVLFLREHTAPRKHSSKKPRFSGQRISGDTASDAACRGAACRALVSGEAAGTSNPSGYLPVQGRITSLVGIRNDPIDGVLRYHKGVDIAIPEGTPVRPVAAGTIVCSDNRSGYGNTVIVEHPDGMTTVYAHNSVNLVKPGERVDRDTVIALSGSTGRSTGPHLHFEAWKEGNNVTSTFLAYGGAEQAYPAARQLYRKENPVRTAILPDGSLLFTNLP